MSGKIGILVSDLELSFLGLDSGFHRLPASVWCVRRRKPPPEVDPVDLILTILGILFLAVLAARVFEEARRA